MVVRRGDSGSADLARRFGDEKGVESCKITTDVPDEAIFEKDWTAHVVFTLEVTAAEVGTLIALFFTYAKRDGLTADRMRSANFTAKNGSTVSMVNEWLDAAQSADVAQTLFAIPDSSFSVSLYVPAGHDRPVLNVTSKVMRDNAKDLTRSAALIMASPVVDLFDISYTITDQGVPDAFTVYADRRIGVAEVAFAAACERWILTHATTGFILPFSTARDAEIIIYTDTEIPDAVRELAADRAIRPTNPPLHPL
jgi:hypothetical protein